MTHASLTWMPREVLLENKVNLWIDLTKLLEGRVGQFKDIILALGQCIIERFVTLSYKKFQYNLPLNKLSWTFCQIWTKSTAIFIMMSSCQDNQDFLRGLFE